MQDIYIELLTVGYHKRFHEKYNSDIFETIVFFQGKTTDEYLLNQDIRDLRYNSVPQYNGRTFMYDRPSLVNS